MFNCQLCGQTVPPRTPAAQIVTETRPKSYPPRRKFYPPLVKSGNEPFPRPNLKARRELWQDDPGGMGSEIVREVRVCPACAARLQLAESAT